MEQIKNKIKELRISKNLTQQQLADKLHVTKQAISKWEKGKSIPDITSVELLSSFFGVSVDYLVNDGAEIKHETTTADRKNKLMVVLISALVVMFAAVVALSVTVGVLFNKDNKTQTVEVNGFEITYLSDETFYINQSNKSFLINFNVYNSTDFSKTCRRENFSINNKSLYIDYIYPADTIAPHEELKISMRIIVRDPVENLGTIPSRSVTVSYAGQSIALIVW